MIYYTLEDLAVKAFSFLGNDVFRKVNIDFFENILKKNIFVAAHALLLKK